MNVGIILQVRMGSTRLPGKVLLPLAGKPLVFHCIDRLLQIKSANLLVAAIPNDASNDILERKLAESPVQIFRGSESDVLDRYYQCALGFKMDHIIRATGDNPFVDPTEAEELIKAHISGGYDYSCCFPEFGGKLPAGVGIEIFRFSALERSWREGKAPNHREHVNEYIQEHQNRFQILFSEGSGKMKYPETNLSIDTAEQLAKAEQRLRKSYQKKVSNQTSHFSSTKS